MKVRTEKTIVVHVELTEQEAKLLHAFLDATANCSGKLLGNYLDRSTIEENFFDSEGDEEINTSDLTRAAADLRQALSNGLKG